MQRRGFLGAMLAAATAPAFVKSESLMGLFVPKTYHTGGIVSSRGNYVLGNGRLWLDEGPEWVDPLRERVEPLRLAIQRNVRYDFAAFEVGVLRAIAAGLTVPYTMLTEAFPDQRTGHSLTIQSPAKQLKKE
jgi:hypothetical protein